MKKAFRTISAPNPVGVKRIYDIIDGNVAAD